MKAFKKILAAAVSVMMMGTIFAACSATTIEQEVVGDWTVSTINGMTRDQYAETVYAPSLRLALNLKLETDKATFTSVDGYLQYQVKYTETNVELVKDGNTIGSISYNKDAQTLDIVNTSPSDGTKISYVFVRGTTDLSEWGGITDDGVPGSYYGERSEEDMMRDEMNDGLTGSDYGELSEEEMRDIMNGGLTGRDYGERTAAEMAEDDARAAANNNKNTNTNTNTNTNSNSNLTNNNNNNNLTGRDYGERTEEDMMRDEMNNGYTGSDYGERSEEEMSQDGLTGRDYGERTEEDMMRDEMNNGYTGRDYGEGEIQ